jgi:2-dehydro-3-deoxyphosphogluconate aldolase / (4S)-4-hydroxy-2-oxoglutarate aldolase
MIALPSLGRVIGIVRTDDVKAARTAALGLLAAGLVPEITMTVPGAATLIAALAPDHLVLAGTVTSVRDVDRCAAAGAVGIVAPNTDARIIARARELGLHAFPGALTPTEVAAAVRAGATGVKLFPAAVVGGPQYVRLLRGPFPHVPLMATGGIEPAAVSGYLAAGCFAVGLGSALLDRDALADGDVEAVAAHVRRAVGPVA